MNTSLGVFTLILLGVKMYDNLEYVKNKLNTGDYKASVYENGLFIDDITDFNVLFELLKDNPDITFKIELYKYELKSIFDLKGVC